MHAEAAVSPCPSELIRGNGNDLVIVAAAADHLRSWPDADIKDVLFLPMPGRHFGERPFALAFAHT